MYRAIGSFILRPLSLLFSIGIVCAFICFFTLRSQVLDYSHLATMQEGNGICFSRVIQTFTAAMMGKQASQHLSSPFIEMTEECYGDIAENFYGQLAVSFPLIGEQLSRMASDVHWFHKKLGTKVINLSMGSGTIENSLVSLENRFSKVESLNDEINKKLESLKGQAYAQLHFSVIALLLSLIFLTIAVVGYFIYESYHRRPRQSFEEKAIREMNQRDLSLVQIKKVLSSILKEHNYNRCDELLSKWYIQFISELEESIAINEKVIPQKSATAFDTEGEEISHGPRLLHRLVKGTKRELLKSKDFLGKVVD